MTQYWSHFKLLIGTLCGGFAKGVKYLNRRTSNLLMMMTSQITKVKFPVIARYISQILLVVFLRWFSWRREISSSSDEQPLAHAINPAPMSEGGQLTKLFYKLYVKFFTQHHTIHRLVPGLIFLSRWVLFELGGYLVTFVFIPSETFLNSCLCWCNWKS